ncbi:MAG: AbrB family transcriptional regulator [Rhodomicrobium sp.]
MVPPGALAHLQPALQWLVLAAISIVLVALLYAIGIPAAFFLGPMAAGVIVGVNGGTVRVPSVTYTGAQAIMGCFIASGISPAILQTFLQDWPLFLGVVFSILTASSALGWIMSRWQVMPASTSVWGSWPGAASAMVIMAAEFGADARLVAFMQYFRVVCVASLASVISLFWQRHGATPPPVVPWFPPLEWPAFPETLLFAGACAAAGRISRIPSGPMLLTLVAASTLHLSGLLEIELPKWLLTATYTLIGWNVGLHFTAAILAHAMSALPKVFLSVSALIAFAGGIAYLLTRILGIDPLTAYLATSPGGMDSVAIIAASTNVDLPFVMALQTIRFVIIVMIGPPVAKFLARQVEAATRGG